MLSAFGGVGRLPSFLRCVSRRWGMFKSRPDQGFLRPWQKQAGFVIVRRLSFSCLVQASSSRCFGRTKRKHLFWARRSVSPCRFFLILLLLKSPTADVQQRQVRNVVPRGTFGHARYPRPWLRRRGPKYIPRSVKFLCVSRSGSAACCSYSRRGSFSLPHQFSAM